METIVVNVDSRFSDKTKYPNPGQFTMQQNDIIKNVKKIKIASIEIPNVFYYFSQKRQNIQFQIVMEQGNPGQTFDIIIREGNYTPDLFVDYIQFSYFDIINELTNGFPTQIERYNFQISLNPNTFLLTISNPVGTRLVDEVSTPVGGANFKLVFPIVSNNPYPSLGINMGYQNTLYESTNLYEAEKVCDLSTDPYCLLRVNNYGILYNNVEDKRILAKIPLNAPRNWVVNENKSQITKEQAFIQPINIDKWEIEVIDLFGNIFDFYGQDISITFEIDVIRNSALYTHFNEGFFNNSPLFQLTPFEAPILYPPIIPPNNTYVPYQPYSDLFSRATQPLFNP